MFQSFKVSKPHPVGRWMHARSRTTHLGRIALLQFARPWIKEDACASAVERSLMAELQK